MLCNNIERIDFVLQCGAREMVHVNVDGTREKRNLHNTHISLVYQQLLHKRLISTHHIHKYHTFTYSYVPNVSCIFCTLDNLCCCHPSLLPCHCFDCWHQQTSSNLRLRFVVVCCSPPLYYFCESSYQKKRGNGE